MNADQKFRAIQILCDQARDKRIEAGVKREKSTAIVMEEYNKDLHAVDVWLEQELAALPEVDTDESKERDNG